MRVGVDLVGHPVGRPPGVPDADVPEKSAGVVLRKEAIFPFTLWILQGSFVEYGDARRVVAPVLEAGESIEHHGYRVPVPNASHDAAHAQ